MTTPLDDAVIRARLRAPARIPVAPPTDATWEAIERRARSRPTRQRVAVVLGGLMVAAAVAVTVVAVDDPDGAETVVGAPSDAAASAGRVFAPDEYVVEPLPASTIDGDKHMTPASPSDHALASISAEQAFAIGGYEGPQFLSRVPRVDLMRFTFDHYGPLVPPGEVAQPILDDRLAWVIRFDGTLTEEVPRPVLDDLSSRGMTEKADVATLPRGVTFVFVDAQTGEYLARIQAHTARVQDAE